MLKLENELRNNYAQTLGGLVILLGVYFTWRNLQLAEDGKITDRYSSAIAQLGNRNMTVRIGGIYALERIARDSQKDHWTVMEALCAFIRDESNKVAPTQPKLRSDIQIALTVVGRRSWVDKEREQGLSLDLSKADLREANLTKADLSWVNLGEANLGGAFLVGAKLTKANLGGAKLTKANLAWANLTSADLREANLTKADLTKADLSGANLISANLCEANLTKADLSGANLTKADLHSFTVSGFNLLSAGLIETTLMVTNLRDADLSSANLSSAKYNEKTRFPEGFDLARLKPDTNDGTD